MNCNNNANTDEFGIPIYIVTKNLKEQVRISINEYKRSEYIDIRIFYLNEVNDEYRPSKKGITLRKDLFPELLRGIVLLGDTIGFDWKQLEEK